MAGSWPESLAASPQARAASSSRWSRSVLLAELPIDLGRSALGAAAGALQVEPGRVEVLGAQAGQRQLRENAAVAFVQSVSLAEQLERGARRSFPEQLAADPTHLLRDGAGLRRSRNDARGAPLQRGDARLPVLSGDAAEQGRRRGRGGRWSTRSAQGTTKTAEDCPRFEVDVSSMKMRRP